MPRPALRIACSGKAVRAPIPAISTVFAANAVNAASIGNIAILLNTYASLTANIQLPFTARRYHVGMDATQNIDLLADSSTEQPAIVSRAFSGVKEPLLDRHWVRGDPYATAFFNALSAVFPHGETFMIRCMMPWADRVPPFLGRQVRAFIEQEAGHAREHVGMNKALIEAGYDVAPLDKKIRGFVKLFENASDIVKLTATMCIEHFTAIVAAEILRDKGHLDGTDGELRELWLWHAVEEVEHKGVAFDVWKYATREWSPARAWAWRSTFMLLITLSFFINRTLGQIELLRQDGIGFAQALRCIMRAGFGKGGIGRNVLRPWVSFFRPSYHPWDKDDRLLLAEGEAMLATMSAERAGFGKPATAPDDRRQDQPLVQAA